MCFLSGPKAHGGKEGLAEGHGGGVRLQAVPVRAGGGQDDPAQRGGQPGHRHEVREDLQILTKNICHKKCRDISLSVQ